MLDRIVPTAGCVFAVLAACWQPGSSGAQVWSGSSYSVIHDSVNGGGGTFQGQLYDVGVSAGQGGTIGVVRGDVYEECLGFWCVSEVCDADSDGFDGDACGGDDCDDLDAATFPGAPEVCDELDNDCDGEVDEGCDGDGPVPGCECRAGAASSAAVGPRAMACLLAVLGLTFALRRRGRTRRVRR